MAAAYAALVSVTRIIDKLRLHPYPPISLHKTQVESLTTKINFLLEFLQLYNPHLGYSIQADPLESRIADAAYAAEDVIESHIVDHIAHEKTSPDGLYKDLEKVIQGMASIVKEAIEIRETLELQNQLKMNSTPTEYSVRSSPNNNMVGVDDALIKMKDKLTSDRRHLQIIPIVGMGGSGKTTLASNIFQDALIQEHFHYCAWATISQDYIIPNIFTQLLNEKVGQHLNQSELGEKLYQYLFGRKYLVVMDDMWTIEAWEKVGMFLPDCKNGSRIVITTRLSNLASQLHGGDSLEMKLLDEHSSWELLSTTVFGQNGCPIDLEEIGKKIAKSCKGLPLSIVVLGGLLAKSQRTTGLWEYISENLIPVVNSVDDESCLRILHMSYTQLPLHLKPCFLYMGVFREDEVVRVSRLTKLFVAEGFLKPINGRSFEETAKEYLKELIDRNLILVHKLGSIGSIKECKIHDMLRDVCLREAKKEGFLYVVSRQHAPQGVTVTQQQRRVAIHNTSKKENLDASHSASLARSLMWGFEKETPPTPRLLRILDSYGCRLPKLDNMSQLVNIRYLASSEWDGSVSLIYGFWNLETHIVHHLSVSLLPAEIWCMPQIRHVDLPMAYFPHPRTGQNDIVLENLLTLRTMICFKCSEEVVKRIPNIKKLGIYYYFNEVEGLSSSLNNLACLQKLESLDICFDKVDIDSLQSLNFPRSLKKLVLDIPRSRFWEDILERIGSLPLLEKLKLYRGSFIECKWEAFEGQFQSLKYLEVKSCPTLKQWRMQSSQFPCLEHLVLAYLNDLEDIPLEFAEIPTLKSIIVKHCSVSVAISAVRIVEEQEESNGEATIRVVIMIEKKKEAVESLASLNIQVKVEGR